MKIKDMLSSIIRSKYMGNKGVRNASSSLALHQQAGQISYPRSDKKKKRPGTKFDYRLCNSTIDKGAY